LIAVAIRSAAAANDAPSRPSARAISARERCASTYSAFVDRHMISRAAG
jgi:hypothetical protein